MYGKHNDINDDEIRIISSDNSRTTRRKRVLVCLCCIVALFVVGGITVMLFSMIGVIEDNTVLTEKAKSPGLKMQPVADSVRAAIPFVERKDTLVNDVRLSILIPYNATPSLEVGNEAIYDSTAVLIVQAADVRDDNGKIVGSFVVRGELVGRGEAKAGFCSIVNGEISVGVADATPMLERALMEDGYFFRQYPLVVGGQIVENKPKGKSIRKALAEYDGRISVIISNDRMSFHDFSQALLDIGVRNAIYLVGGESYGCYTDFTGKKNAIGSVWNKEKGSINYMVWR